MGAPDADGMEVDMRRMFEVASVMVVGELGLLPDVLVPIGGGERKEGYDVFTEISAVAGGSVGGPGAAPSPVL